MAQISANPAPDAKRQLTEGLRDAIYVCVEMEETVKSFAPESQSLLADRL